MGSVTPSATLHKHVLGKNKRMMIIVNNNKCHIFKSAELIYVMQSQCAKPLNHNRLNSNFNIKSIDVGYFRCEFIESET